MLVRQKLFYLTDFISSQSRLLFSLSSYKVGCTRCVALLPDLMASQTASAATITLFMAAWVLDLGTFFLKDHRKRELIESPISMAKKQG